MYDQSKLKRIRLIIVGIGLLIGIGVIALVVHVVFPTQQDKNTQAATTAAKKINKNAEATQVTIADGFAMAIVKDPTASDQSNAGNTTIFKVSSDGSMTQIASSSIFSPIDLLGMGISFATQGKLTNTSTSQVRSNLANACSYGGSNAPGYSGFNNSFSPDQWQIDSGTLSGLQQALSAAISQKNTALDFGKKTICINATQDGSNATTDTTTYISTFTLQVQFITNDGELTKHTLTFATGPKYYRSYMLDGSTLSSS